MDINRKKWNEGQQALRQALGGSNHEQAVDLFLRQHAMLHCAEMAGAGLWSFADEVWQDLSEESARRIPLGAEHSIVWTTWHSARIEDLTMSLLLVEMPQLFEQDDWAGRLNLPFRHAGNGMSNAEMAEMSASINLGALHAYRLAVGRRTQDFVRQLTPAELWKKVSPAALEQVRAREAVAGQANELLAYWGGLTKAGLLLMPPTRHNFLHLNEALRIKSRHK